MPASGIYGGHDGAAGGAATSGYSKQGAAKAGGGGGSTSKRQQQLAGAKYGATGPSNNSKVANGLLVGQTTTLASLKLGATQAGQDQGGGAGMGGGTYKFKANNAGSKGGSKYISPYSLRHLAGGAAGMGAPGT
ncbi:hypothetical protein DUNSADRAFT_18011 [Dunaliella salina]|uniref:Encoded protein n=1 Tax=Dunaliella salina TaxID=3046 RepID=A0ABQ7G0U0_DUNSA|nr:hypothetical protein DUNSADRAFT_18011 [Dunaliella salina]|eukprot:KAF5828218.1 hypothetical protein DUNSADRAFT_18011 [Dunaliella salina]